MMENELTYWVALTHTPKIWIKRKNEIIVHCFNHGLAAEIKVRTIDFVFLN